MTTSATTHPTSTSQHITSRTSKAYWIALGLFAVMFGYSAILTLVDPVGSEQATANLGYPGYLGVYPLAIAKSAGLLVIFSRRSRTLTHFAFAGFLFDLLLALAGHIHTNDFPAGWLAVFGLVLWVAAFIMESRRAAT